MNNHRRHALPLEKKRIIGRVKGTFETQAISDDSARDAATNRAIPAEHCVKENKDWVDFNEK